MFYILLTSTLPTPFSPSKKELYYIRLCFVIHLNTGQLELQILAYYTIVHAFFSSIFLVRSIFSYESSFVNML